MNLKITPAPLSGTLSLPPSKSLSHRALICASLAQGTSHLANLLIADDLTATTEAMKSLGADIIEVAPGEMTVRGIQSTQKYESTIDCNESGSTLRFLIPLGLNGQKNIFTGRGRLVERPQQIYRDIFERQQIHYQKPEHQELPLEVQGFLQPDHFIFPGNVSSQFISGLLFALPRLKGDSQITLTDALESKDYIDLTLSMLRKFQIQVNVSPDYLHYHIPGNQSYKPQKITVESDYSQAAFWIAAGLLGKGITLSGLEPDSLQGDRAILPIIQSMNGTYHWQEGNLIVSPSVLQEAVIDVTHCPDLVPILAVLATQSQGITKIINAGRLRLKESDRLFAMKSELTKLGADIGEEADALIIYGSTPLRGGIVHSHKDHRIAMALGIASLLCSKELVVEDADVVSKSYPDFWQDFTQMGGIIHEC